MSLKPQKKELNLKLPRTQSRTDMSCRGEHDTGTLKEVSEIHSLGSDKGSTA